MKRAIFTIALILGANFAPCLWAAESPPDGTTANPPPASSQIQYTSLEAYMNGEIGKLSSLNGNMAVAVATVLDNQTHLFFFGETAPGNGTKPDGNTIFRLASVSKTFTGALFALDIQKHLVKPDDPLQNYLPQGVSAPLFNNNAQDPIRLQMLATHTSGLLDMPVLPNYNRPTTPNETLRSLQAAVLASAPGVKFSYSNYGFSVLGQVLASIENQLYVDLVRQNITDPLGMLDTKVGGQLDASESSRLVQGTNPVAGEWTFFPGENPAGGYYSSLNDMVKYLAFVMGDTASSLNSIRPLLFQPLHSEGAYYAQIGLSWDLVAMAGSSEPAIWKYGSLLGYQSFIGFLPNKHIGLVILLNSEAVNLSSVVNNTLAFLMTNPSQTMPTPQEPPHSPIENLPQGPGPVEQN